MDENQRKLVLLVLTITIGSIALIAVSVILYFNIYIEIQSQSCINSPNCHEEQKQMPWLEPLPERNFQISNLGERLEDFFII